MRAPFGDPYADEEEDPALAEPPPDPEAQRAALDDLVATANPKAAKPKGYGAELGADALAKAQKKDAYERASGDTSAAMYAAFARKPMPAAHDTSDTANLLERRKGADQEEALAGRQTALAKNAERADPASQSSQIARALLRKSLPEVADSIGPQFERMSHATIMENFPFMKAIVDSHHRRQLLDKPLSPPPVVNVKQRSELDDELEQARINKLNRLPPARPVKGPAEMTPYQKARLERINSQNDDPNSEPNDPAHVHMLQPTQAAALQAQRAAVDSAQAAIDFSKQQLARYGRRLANPLDKDAQTALGVMRSRLSEALPQLSQANGFGNPTVSHLDIAMKSLGGDPLEVANLFNQGRMHAILDSVMESANTRYGLTLRSTDRHRKGAGGAGPPGRIRVRDANGRTGWADPSKPLPPGVEAVTDG